MLGLVQGLTQYLPVSSSGHLTIGQELLGVTSDENLVFDVAVHVATVLSTLVILWKEVAWLFQGFFKFKWNDETRYVVNILVSMIPVGVVGLCFKDSIEGIYEGNNSYQIGFLDKDGNLLESYDMGMGVLSTDFNFADVSMRFSDDTITLFAKGNESDDLYKIGVFDRKTHEFTESFEKV